MIRLPRPIVALFGLGAFVTAELPGQVRDTLTVFAAADLALALPEIAQSFEAATGTAVNFVFGSSGNLALQIQHGAPADVLFSANVGYIDQLIAEGELNPGTRTLYARGRIVLALPRASAIPVWTLEDLLRPDVRRIAIANPDHAPYGTAAKEALEAKGLWTQLEPKLVIGENVRQTLQYVQTGAVDAGIVALAVAGVPEVRYMVIDERWHRPLEQAAALTKRSRHARAAAEFVAYLIGPGWPMMEKNGFIRPSSR